MVDHALGVAGGPGGIVKRNRVPLVSRPEDDIRQAIAEAHHMHKPDGKLCVARLTEGVTVASRIVSAGKVEDNSTPAI
ncbi:MAG: hypothetical protein WA632_09180 [Gallionella sp.]